MVGGSTVRSIIGILEEPLGGSTTRSIRGASIVPIGGSTVRALKNTALIPAASPIYNLAITEVRERAISPNYALIINEFRERAISPNYAYQIGELFEGLIRSKQITERDITADRLVDIPVQVLSSRSGVDMTTTAVSELLAPATGKIAIILGILFEVTQANTVTVPATISVGVASGEDDIFASEAMQDFNAVGDTWSNWLVFSHARAVTSGETAKVNITGATATALVSDIHLIGFLV